MSNDYPHYERIGSDNVNNTDTQKTANRRSTTLKFRHILIITYGRSGSTLLQGVLNGIEGVVLRGENDNAFFDLYKTYKKLLDLKQKNWLRRSNPLARGMESAYLKSKSSWQDSRMWLESYCSQTNTTTLRI